MNDTLAFALRPPARQTLAENICDSLREAIFAGAFRQGQRLAEAQLAQQLEVSRAPVREALAVLEQEGLVSRSSAGTTVNRLERDDVVEICTLRHTLESLAMRLTLGQPTEGLCQSLAKNIEQARHSTDAAHLARLDLEFHELIVAAAGHRRLLANWQLLRSQIRLLMTQHNLADSHSQHATVRAHEELLALVQARDVDGAVAMLQRQLESQYDWMLRSVDISFES